jgi:protocatechuate 3,4-dioxygenase beta subunit
MDAQMLRSEIIAAVLLAPALWAQSIGVVEGAVVNSVTRAGIGGVTVEVTRADGPWRTSATTDAAGRFRISGLAPGKYRAEFAHPEFTDPQPGQTEGMSFAIGPISEPARVRVELQPLSTLRGRLLDSDGRPMRGVRVSLQRLLRQGVYENPTDKEGRFEFVDVKPATYLLAAEPPEIDGERSVLARTYYPGVLDHRQAAPIAIPAGQELAGFEFRLVTSPVFRVRGKVVDSAGSPVAGAMVELHSEDPFASESQRFTLQDGSFEFPSVLPGSWRSVAVLYPAVPAVRQVKPAEDSRTSTEMNRPVQRGSAMVEVKHQDVDGVEIRISPE